MRAVMMAMAGSLLLAGVAAAGEFEGVIVLNETSEGVTVRQQWFLKGDALRFEETGPDAEKGAMIFDDVQQKRTAESNLEEVWKEVTRDLITANRLGREEATSPAMEALNCLRAPE